MIARIAVAGLLAVNVALVPWPGGGTPSGLCRTELSGRAGPSAAQPHARMAVGRGQVTTPGAAAQARLRAAFGRLPLSFERNVGQAGHGVDFAARGTGYALLVTSAGATLVLAAPHTATRTQPRAGAQGPQPAVARSNVRPATGPLTSTSTTTPTVASTPDASGTSTLVPAATAAITPADTAVTPADTAGASPATAALTDTAAPTAAPAAPGRRGRPTAPPGSGTVTALPAAPHGIVRHTSGISQTTVLTPTGLLPAMALHLQHHGHAHGQDKRHTPAAPPAVVQLAFVGANPSPHVVGLDPRAGTATYLHGTNRRAWTTKAPTYGRVAYQALYPGIDLAFHGRQGTLEYDWLLAPRAAAGRIRLAVRGAGTLRLDGQGNLLLRTAAGTLRQARPVAYSRPARGTAPSPRATCCGRATRSASPWAPTTTPSRW